jgi:spore coat protein U-like protein
MNKWISRSAFFAAALFLGLNGGNATTIDTKSLNVQVAVSSTCSITSISGVTFPSIIAGVPFSTETANGNVTVLCTGNSYNVNADAGGNAGTTGDVTTRNLLVSGGGASLPYHLFVNGGLTEWGDATSGVPFSGTASPTPTSIIVNGSLPGATPTASGVYSDVVIVTLTN